MSEPPSAARLASLSLLPRFSPSLEPSFLAPFCTLSAAAGGGRAAAEAHGEARGALARWVILRLGALAGAHAGEQPGASRQEPHHSPHHAQLLRAVCTGKGGAGWPCLLHRATVGPNWQGSHPPLANRHSHLCR